MVFPISLRIRINGVGICISNSLNDQNQQKDRGNRYKTSYNMQSLTGHIAADLFIVHERKQQTRRKW